MGRTLTIPCARMRHAVKCGRRTSFLCGHECKEVNVEIPDKKEPKVVAPGTLVLVAIFLAFFVMMILVNFHMLSRAWPIH